MLELSQLKPYKGSTRRRKVIGRGVGSGHGTFSGRGAKGQKARSGSSIPVGFEGGRMPLHRQIPKKRGFKSLSPKAQALSLADLAVKFSSGETVNPKNLVNKGLIKSQLTSVKILGDGELAKALNFENVLLSAAAKAKIEKAGGKVT
ncbi:MAG: 50S ribosomal protein L15 [Candidatus Doudnabacteria bacterium RIFCSPHIGHO2_12_FULL_48_11]|uniref:Large ribosomal subunit protein uL15 n=1 Tax=Candidatus Doudnabacteria bacterium RIFCSPHIGHO2_01_FULL_46_24 TaxID=1817825 RepID=A0A1F5NVT7_9BACT|nr:ribosomal protein L15 [uncultured bacterium]OGE81460.1 MAG: 50S ribosomal protein L15 [Candidatus Doudnabacteria bacterium RIFCSPHIGHO2_01_FULL_46_24]OGE95922.1 MAG: 50S ribosomal protein L15 [Candidatus Doudnabacteria bacterium RIFCSPHIGHO2_12_FULL_48_11]